MQIKAWTYPKHTQNRCVKHNYNYIRRITHKKPYSDSKNMLKTNCTTPIQNLDSFESYGDGASVIEERV